MKNILTPPAYYTQQQHQPKNLYDIHKIKINRNQIKGTFYKDDDNDDDDNGR